MGIILISVAGGSILIGDSVTGLNIGWLGLPSLLLIVIYLISARILFSREKRRREADGKADQETVLLYESVKIRPTWIKFSVAAVAIIGSGIWLSYIGNEISVVTGWGTTFVGSILLAITTSMPELVVAVAALRFGGADLAMGNILGANMLDITYIGIMDLLYNEAPILASVSSSHLITIGLLIGMNLVLILGLKLRTPRKTFGIISWYSVVILGLYIYGAWGLFNAALNGQ
jgi:cation:H+ antiporter